MSGFNLQQLRKRVQAIPEMDRVDFVPAIHAMQCELSPEFVLALIDVVEASHRCAAMEQDYSSHEEVIDDEGAPCPQCVKWRGTMDDLEAALTQFSFEEPA